MAKKRSRTTARSRTAGRATARRRKTTARRKTAAKSEAAKTSSRKRPAGKAAARKKAAAPRRKTSRTTAAELRKRAAAAEKEVQVEAGTEGASGVETLAVSLAGLDVPDIDLSNIEGAVREVMDFVEENPVAAAAMALGAGAVLTSMYWDKVSGRGKK